MKLIRPFPQRRSGSVPFSAIFRAMAIFTLALFYSNSYAAIDAPLLHYFGRMDGCAGNTLHFSPDGSKLLTSGGDAARVWDAGTRKPLTPPIVFGAPIDDSGWIGKGDRFFLAGGKRIEIWGSRTLRPVQTLSQDAPVKPVCFSSDGMLAMSGNAPGSGCLWDVRTGKKIRSLLGPDKIRSITFVFHDKSLLIIWSGPSRISNCSVRLVDVKTGRDLLAPIQCDPPWECDPVAEVSPNGSKLAVAFEKEFKVFDLPGGKELFSVHYDDIGIETGLSRMVHFTSDGSGVIWSVNDWSRLYNAATGEPRGNKTDEYVITTSRDDFWSNHDGNLLFVASVSDVAGVWDMHSGRRLEPLSNHETDVLSMSPDHRMLAASSLNMKSRRDGFTEIWKITGEVK